VVPLGDFWSCYIFKMNLKEKGPFLLMIYLVIRSSLVLKVQNYTNQIYLFKKISYLGLNRKFYLAYLSHFILYFISYDLLTLIFNDQNTIYNFSFIIVLLGSELIARLGMIFTTKN
jgi:hypothetical protein